METTFNFQILCSFKKILKQNLAKAHPEIRDSRESQGTTSKEII
jgi:hypothetical protein